MRYSESITWWDETESGHRWRRDSKGKIDMWAMEADTDTGWHHGPECSVCGFSFCPICFEEELPPCSKP